MAHELFSSSWVAFTELPYSAEGGTSLARTELHFGDICYSNDVFTCVNTPVDKAVDYLTTRIYNEETIQTIPFDDLPPLIEATEEEILKRMMKLIKEMRADECIDASTSNATGILFGDEMSRLLEEAQDRVEGK